MARPKNKNQIKLCVVGDLMQDFSRHKNVITISELERLIQAKHFDKRATKYEIHVGQGISGSRLKALSANIENAQLSSLININLPKYLNPDTEQSFNNKNVISEPNPYAYNEYESLLVLENANLGLNDLVVGRHIQTIFLLEAARQMLIAVTEKYHLANESRGKLDFIIQSMDTVFHQFVFPLSVAIRYKIKEFKKTSNCNLSSRANIAFVQNETVVAEIGCRFAVLDSGFMAEKESYLADRCIKAFLT